MSNLRESYSCLLIQRYYKKHYASILLRGKKQVYNKYATLVLITYY